MLQCQGGCAAASFCRQLARPPSSIHLAKAVAPAGRDRPLLPPLAGGVELDKPEYSGGVRQELHKIAQQLNQSDVQILQGGVTDYWERMMRSK